jgi:hypothetical protein
MLLTVLQGLKDFLLEFSRTCALTQPKEIYILLIQFYGSMSVLIRKNIGNNTMLRTGSCVGMLCCCFSEKVENRVMLHCCWRIEGRNQFSCSCVQDVFIDFNSPTLHCSRSLDSLLTHPPLSKWRRKFSPKT